MKMAWRRILLEWKEDTGKCSTTLNKDAFPALLNKLHEALKDTGPANLVAGFQKTGIYPLNKDPMMKNFLVLNFHHARVQPM